MTDRQPKLNICSTCQNMFAAQRIRNPAYCSNNCRQHADRIRRRIVRLETELAELKANQPIRLQEDRSMGSSRREGP